MVRTAVSAVRYERILASLRSELGKVATHRRGVIRQGVHPLRRLLELFAARKAEGVLKANFTVMYIAQNATSKFFFIDSYFPKISPLT